MKPSSFCKGREGEERAARELEQRGIRVIERNFRSPAGEVDIIGIEGETLVFIEVKNWKTYSIDNLEYALNKKKQKRIIETAKFFCLKHRQYRGMAIRFDILFISRNEVTHITAAWTEYL